MVQKWHTFLVRLLHQILAISNLFHCQMQDATVTLDNDWDNKHVVSCC